MVGRFTQFYTLHFLLLRSGRPINEFQCFIFYSNTRQSLEVVAKITRQSVQRAALAKLQPLFDIEAYIFIILQFYFIIDVPHLIKIYFKGVSCENK